jgi:Skp family chaperone for outer membrane proteins
MELENRLQNSTTVLTDAKRLEMKQEIEKLKLEYKSDLQNAQRDLVQLQQQFSKDYNSKLMPILDKLAKEKGYDIIMRNEVSIWHNPAIDITDEFIKRVNAAIK